MPSELIPRRTGIFFHFQQAQRLADFPAALSGILEQPNVFYYDAFYPDKAKALYDLEAVSAELLAAVHAPAMLEEVRRLPYYESALFSAGGTVQAAEAIWGGQIDNAFVFTGVGDHHAGRNFFGGGCYLNGAAMAIERLRRLGGRRFAIVDTDAHHGNGTWDIFARDPDVLYVCLCTAEAAEINSKVNVHLPWRLNDEDYLALIEAEFGRRARAFSPEVIFWNWGYDGTKGDYGDLGLSRDVHEAIAQRLRQLADAVCTGRLVAVLCGGARRDIARYAIPRIIRQLSGDAS